MVSQNRVLAYRGDHLGGSSSSHVRGAATMKRSLLKRKTPLVRKKWMWATRKTKYRRRARDPAYMAWVRIQPCCARVFSHLTLCRGPIEADHAGRRGVGQKADDRTCIPLCRQHHRERTDFSGAFKEWSGTRMRLWLNVMIARCQAEYHLEQEQGDQHG